jgi:putative redox protein
MPTDKRSAKLAWRERMTFDAMALTGHRLVLDASKTSGGDDRGPNPMELLLIALAGCTAMDVVSILQKKREPLKGLEVIVEGTRAHEHPKVYTDIEVVYRAHGKVKPQALAHAIELSETKYCSVGAMLAKSARITTRFEIESGEHEPASSSKPPLG